jgi:hypothetical protein
MDATRDGGTWWFPQSGTYSATEPHQGKALADTFRARGFSVDELPRDGAVQSSLLANYRLVIRAGTCGTYSTSELAAYDQLIARDVALILLTDHMLGGCTTTDPLALRYGGITYTGGETGTVDQFAPHAITAGVSKLTYNAGATVVSSNSSKVELLGFIGPTRKPVMGVINGFAARIFFLGDTNGLETVPQPLVNNLIAWAFGN